MQPCSSCVANNSTSECHFPRKERKVPVSESYLRRLEADSKRLRDISGARDLQTPESQQNTPGPSHPGDKDDSLRLSTEESNMLNPMFDGRSANLNLGRPSSGYEPGFIGEASCAAFSNRLLQCLDDTYTPSTAVFSNFHRLNHYRLSMMDPTDDFPERMHAKLLLNVARRFIGNYHPLFHEVTFMRELDAVYRGELTPSALWLCKFYALMALGEIYTNRRGTDEGCIVPGTRYYERSVHMLQDYDLYEEPSLMHVEVRTLLVRLIHLPPVQPYTRQGQRTAQLMQKWQQAWASNVFGRIRTAYCYSGNAMRLAMSLGMHRAASSSTTLTPVERESRRRTWWVLYFFDRFSASKLGQPPTVRDEDIDVEMPTIEGLTEEERAEFLDPQPLVTNAKLARIIGNICSYNPQGGICILCTP
ncbi:fungal specific transcription factor domain-containing protein [Candidatus Bathyarchaeota archaeon]|nr:fungal specific transcription factor domain-containing protein [Candidatus Bathyarchaeota archaeon]